MKAGLAFCKAFESRTSSLNLVHVKKVVESGLKRGHNDENEVLRLPF